MKAADMLLLAACALALVAYVRRPQIAVGIVSDTEPYAGLAAWEWQTKLRTVEGQNESAKIE